MIIATLPPVYQEELSEQIASHPRVDVLRYNTGMDSYFDPDETLVLLKQLTERFGKKLWLDLKGRQLRIKEWVTPGYSEIVLNHAIEVTGPARVHFRGSGWTNLKYADGNRIFVDPLPPQALGKGQSVNVVGADVKITGYLTDLDREYIELAKPCGVGGFLLSFVERVSDISEVMSIWGDDKESMPDLILKIESARGLEFIRNFSVEPFASASNLVTPMLARDDLFNELGSGPLVLSAATELIQGYPEAITASRLWSGLERTGEATVADFADWHLLHQQGYKNFMLSDGLCLRQFTAAMEAIEEYYQAYPEKE